MWDWRNRLREEEMKEEVKKKGEMMVEEKEKGEEEG